MNLDDAFTAGLVIYTRQLLGKAHPAQPDFPHIGRCVFRMLERGTFRPKAQTPEGIDAWSDYVRRYDLRDIWLLVPTDGNINYLGFVNYRNNAIVCRWKKKTTLLELQWEYDKAASLWTVTLTERFNEESEASRPHMRFSRRAYTDLLTELADFSDFLEEPFFARQFRHAAACLSDPQAPTPEGELPPSLPQPFLGVWNALSYASVIGCMGSWNDIPQGKAIANMSGIKYQRLTNELVHQNRLALTFAANEFINPEAVSCEFPPERRLKHDTPTDNNQ